MHVSACALLGLVGLLAGGKEPPPRYAITADLKSFRQGTPKETLAAVLKAADLKRFDYLLAHLADPAWVDGRVEQYAGGFAELVKETSAKLDAAALKQLKRFLKEGEFTEVDSTAVVRLKEVSDRVVRLRKQGGRWFLENRSDP